MSRSSIKKRATERSRTTRIKNKKKIKEIKPGILHKLKLKKKTVYSD